MLALWTLRSGKAQDNIMYVVWDILYILTFIRIYIMSQRNGGGILSSICPVNNLQKSTTLIARFMGPTWGPSGTDRAHVGSMNLGIWACVLIAYNILFMKIHPVFKCSAVVVAMIFYLHLTCNLNRLSRFCSDTSKCRYRFYHHTWTLDKTVAPMGELPGLW